MAEGGGCPARRKTLTIALAGILTEMGYDSIDKVAMETLSEMAQSFMTEVGISSRAYCELAGRVEPLLGDVVISMVEMGFNLEGIEKHARRNQRIILPALTTATQPKQLAILQAGQKLSHPAHIPAHLPNFPDPHAYIRTPTHKQPVTEYEALREKAASQKRDVERALTRFVAKTGDTHSLFLTDDTNLFPLIACKPQPKPYLDALIPRDQVFDEEEEEIEQVRPPPRRSRRDDPQNSSLSDKEAQGASPPPSPPPGTPLTPNSVKLESGGRGASLEPQSDCDVIDNPYLRPVKLPRKSTSRSK